MPTRQWDLSSESLKMNRIYLRLFSHTLAITNQMKTNGEEINIVKIMKKKFRSDIDELMDFLMIPKQWINKYIQIK